MSTPCPVPRNPGPAAGTAPGIYQRRRPERTVPYQAIQEHLETWLARQREADPEGDPIPAYVERDLRRYLGCGILAYGFARARCEACGHDFLIAFSCKGRGVCPSCNTRRMAETAAHLVDHVEPHQPPPIHPPRGPPGWSDADEQVFLDEDLDQDRYEIDKSSGQKICTVTGRPQGDAQGSAP